MWLIQRFCNKLRLKKRLQDYVRLPQRRSEYHSSAMILALLYAIIMGLRRINKTDILQYNGAFLEMLGLNRFPDQSTLRRFLKRLAPQSIRQIARLHDSLRAYLFPLPHQRNSLVFDVDSTVLIIYGWAEGARVGYNPKKPGRQVLPSLALLRGKFPGVLAWQLTPRQRRCFDRCRALSQSLFGESPFDHRSLAYALSHGLGFLRQPCDSLPGRRGMRLRDGGAGVSQHQGTRPSLPLPSARQRLAGRRVPRQGASQHETLATASSWRAVRFLKTQRTRPN